MISSLFGLLPASHERNPIYYNLATANSIGEEEKREEEA
jgi:hypothetical protein